MKYLILLVFGAGLAVGSVYYVHHTRASSIGPAQPTTGPSQPAAVTDEQKVLEIAQIQRQPQPPAPEQSKLQIAPNLSATAHNTQLDKIAVTRAVDVLVSPQASYEQKHSVWAQLKASGSLDQAIRDLEERTANNPASPECAASLGEAYLQKCGTISDVREQGILAMQADKVFDTALSLDPANWEARFTKAVALSYWPANMNKGEEVVQHFTTLIQQQETQPVQPQFADTYVWLGDQYQKSGRMDDARSVWERGAVLFPEQQELKSRLAASP
jgi:tetratricopeptide (TPR) repeat protein